MEPDLLRAFVESAEAGSFSRAARNLSLAQPSLTAQIQRLERHLGAPLFKRHARGVILSEAGAVLLPRAKQLLAEHRAVEFAVRREQDEAAHTVAVGAIPTIAPYLFPAALQRLRRTHAHARVTLREDFSAVLLRALMDGELDVAIAAQPYDFGDLETEGLGADALVVAVPHTHAAARAGRITLEQLRASPSITLDPAHCLGAQVDGFCASHGITPSVVCRSAQLATVLGLVGIGLGVSIVPAMAAARHNTPQCAYVPLVAHDLEREIVAVWPRGRQRTAVAEAVVDSVRETLRDG